MTHRTLRARRHLWKTLCALVVSSCVGAPASAQLRLPEVGLNAVPTLPGPAGLLRNAVPSSGAVSLRDLRKSTVRALLREHRDVIEADRAGEPAVRGELLLLSPPQAVVDQAVALGFRVVRDEVLEGLELRRLVLRPPPGSSTVEALDRLRALGPDVEADFNHVFTRSGNVAQTGAAAAGTSASASAPASGSAAAPEARQVGLIDSGIDTLHPALRQARVKTWGCDGLRIASPHGTAVASLLVGSDAPFLGVAPAATLHAADIYCGRATGGSAEAVADALAWMAREKVAVINISLVGPFNVLLQRAVRSVSEKGHLVVAAAGNDGPAAAPLYPAAYADVVAVTGVMPSKRILPEAAQGAHIAFAAPGAELAVARAGEPGYGVARGTSFAAPLVAGLLSELHRRPDAGNARDAVQRLSALALDLGAPGRDPVFGWGLVAESARIAPEFVHASAGGLP